MLTVITFENTHKENKMDTVDIFKILDLEINQEYVKEIIRLDSNQICDVTINKIVDIVRNSKRTLVVTRNIDSSTSRLIRVTTQIKLTTSKYLVDFVVFPHISAYYGYTFKPVTRQELVRVADVLERFNRTSNEVNPKLHPKMQELLNSNLQTFNIPTIDVTISGYHDTRVRDFKIGQNLSVSVIE